MNKKVRAGSLLYALCIALILAILSSSIILLAFNVRNVIDRDLLFQKQLRNVSSAINYYLIFHNKWSYNTQTIDLFDHGSDNVDIKQKPWGFFDVVCCRAYQNTVYSEAAFMVGDKPVKNVTALYLTDNNKPLAVCGKTQIKGKSYLPLQGVKRAYIEGQNFTGNKLIEGEHLRSEPTVKEFLKKYDIKYFTALHIDTEDSIVDIHSLEANKNVVNSFLNSTIVLTSNGNLDIDNYSLLGNIIVQSTGRVNIKSSSKLEHILVVGESIIVEKGFEGSLQLFASDSIIVKEEVRLLYPSSVCVFNSTGTKLDNSKILVSRDAVVKGIVANGNAMDVQRRSVNLKIDEGALITGLVYSKGYIDFKGSVAGSLYCGGFILRTPSAVYENHLLNAVINTDALPADYVGVFPDQEVKRKAIIGKLL